jgi:hypothetical protein
MSVEARRGITFKTQNLKFITLEFMMQDPILRLLVVLSIYLPFSTQ